MYFLGVIDDISNGIFTLSFWNNSTGIFLGIDGFIKGNITVSFWGIIAGFISGNITDIVLGIIDGSHSGLFTVLL